MRSRWKKRRTKSTERKKKKPAVRLRNYSNRSEVSSYRFFFFILFYFTFSVGWVGRLAESVCKSDGDDKFAMKRPRCKFLNISITRDGSFASSRGAGDDNGVANLHARDERGRQTWARTPVEWVTANRFTHYANRSRIMRTGYLVRTSHDIVAKIMQSDKFRWGVGVLEMGCVDANYIKLVRVISRTIVCMCTLKK